MKNTIVNNGDGIRIDLNRDFLLQNIFIGIQRKSDESIIKRDCKLDGLESYLYLRGDDRMVGSYRIKMTDSLLGHAGISEQEAWVQAEKNTVKETTVAPIGQVLSAMADVSYDESEEENPIYVVTNRLRMFGASSILDKKVLEKIGKKYSTRRLIVLPSSIHEMLVLPYSENLDMKEMSDMVRQINETQVEPEERLTDQAYLIEI